MTGSGQKNRGLGVQVRDLVEDNSFEDVEGLLINVGVVAALMLSVASGLFLSVDMEQMILGDYRVRLATTRRFRLLVRDVLLRKEKGFNFTVPDVDGPFDIEAVLTMPDDYISWSNFELLHQVDKVFHWTKKELPEGFLYSPDLIGSGTVYLCAIISVAVYSSIVIAALFLYTALVISPAREMMMKTDEDEDEDEKEKQHKSAGVKAFNRWAMPVIWFLYMAMCGATVAFFWGFVTLLRLRSPSWALAERHVRHWGMSLGGILIFGGMLASVFAAGNVFLVAIKLAGKSSGKKTLRQRTVQCLESLEELNRQLLHSTEPGSPSGRSGRSEREGTEEDLRANCGNSADRANSAGSAGSGGRRGPERAFVGGEPSKQREAREAATGETDLRQVAKASSPSSAPSKVHPFGPEY